ncbi:hypothetical protein [Paraburkholderia aspalathi]|uniref:hypothetical protein n=1 Tax=Paraburkholderia aspalathi TaxID=1324617 RepID=UPI0038B7689C
MLGTAALGICGLRKFEPDSHFRQPRYGWWVVKYSDEPCIDLTTFTDDAVDTFSREFGIVNLDRNRGVRRSDQNMRELFFCSPAWQALREWVTKYPGIAQSYRRRRLYLPDWYERATAPE